MLSAFLGLLCLLNLVASAGWGSFNANLWWIDLRHLPAGVSAGLQVLAALSLVWFAVDPPAPALRKVRQAARIVLLVLAAMAAVNAVSFYLLLGRGVIRSSLPVPFSFLIAAVLLAIAGRRVPRGRPGFGAVLMTAAVCVVGFPLGQMFLFGKTDYSRPADVIVVFGARAYADGRPSDALADRVRTACELYRQGLAPKLLFSGGPGDGELSEPQVMRNFAVHQGVPFDAILLDEQGLNTAATVGNTVPLLRGRRVLAVSHFYHLPRVKLSYQQAGFDVYTVPARERYMLTQMPRLVVREVAALWVYYLRGLR